MKAGGEGCEEASSITVVALYNDALCRTGCVQGNTWQTPDVDLSGIDSLRRLSHR